MAAVCAVVPGLGRSRVPQLIKFFGSAKALYCATEAQLKASRLCTDKQIYNFVNNRQDNYPQKLLHRCNELGIKIISIYDEEYPESLKEIHDPPLVLYVKGNLPLIKYGLAVVGSRESSAYGIKAASIFAQAFAREHIPVISGGARGIDTAAHQACMEAGGETVAVLGCGLDIAYPAENRNLFAEICSHGALVSEYPPGTSPLARNFPARNRIIVGLARGILVAEAAVKSGALITAHIAADENRDVYCIPGSIFAETSRGCHELIRTGAKLVEEPDDIFEDIVDWYQNNSVQQTLFAETDKQNENSAVIRENISATGKVIINLLAQGSLSLDEITEQSGKTFAEISMELLDLQVMGLIATDQAQKYYCI